MEKLEKLPESFAIKRDADNPLWQKYINWLYPDNPDNKFFGQSQCFYGFDGIGAICFKSIESLDPIILTLEQWDSIVNPFVLPEKWCLKRTKETYKEI